MASWQAHENQKSGSSKQLDNRYQGRMTRDLQSTNIWPGLTHLLLQLTWLELIRAQFYAAEMMHTYPGPLRKQDATVQKINFSPFPS